MGKPSKDHRDITGRVEILEPAELAELLDSNKHNRTLSDVLAERYADQMPREWKVTGEPIIIGSNGKLLDGQHRCRAALLAETSLTTFVVRGVNPKDFHSMGTGKGRSLKDVIDIDGKHICTSTLASALSWLWRYEHKAMLSSAAAAGLTNKRGLQLLRKHPDLPESVAALTGTWQRDIGLFSGHCTLHYLYSQISKRKMADFWYRLSPEGHEAGRKAPANVLVSWLLKHVVRATRKASKLEVMAVSAKAIRAHFQGKEIGSLRWQQGGTKAEDFPALLPKLESHGVRLRHDKEE